MAQVPAIIYSVVFPWEPAGYVEMIYVNDLSYGEDDPVLCACWDFYIETWVDIGWKGVYQHCYNDAQADWYKQHNAWRGA